MSDTPEIKVTPADLTYIDEAQLQTRTSDEEWEDAFDLGDRPEDYPEPARSSFKEFLERTGYGS